jgi:hypothetical protein
MVSSSRSSENLLMQLQKNLHLCQEFSRCEAKVRSGDPQLRPQKTASCETTHFHRSKQWNSLLRIWRKPDLLIGRERIKLSQFQFDLVWNEREIPLRTEL